MEGMIVYSHYNRLGTIDKNTEAGIYGTIESAEKLFATGDGSVAGGEKNKGSL